MKTETETKYYVRCRMSETDYWRVTDWTNNIEDIQSIIEHRKSTYRYIESVSYEAMKTPHTESKRGNKNARTAQK